MKTILYLRLFQTVFFCFLFLLQTINVFAGRTTSCADCYPPLGGYTRMAANLSQSKALQTFDVSALNLKNVTAQNSVQQTNSAISVGLADFNTISAVGNSWLLYQANSGTFSMNIGTANNASPQTWALPANFSTFFQGAGRSDFIAPSSIPTALQIEGANKVMRTYYIDNNNNPMEVYDHYNLNSSSIDHIGTSYDLEVGDDDTFDEPNYEFSDVPLDLGDNFVSTIEEEDYLSNLTLTKYIETKTVDAYGTIATPDGTFNCLRISISIQKYTRPNESSAYTLVSTTNQVSFMTKEGAFFNAQVSATSGTATLSDFQYREIVPTSSLSEPNDVKLNNDSKGVTINTDNATAHLSAIFDVKSDNSGILIPRIAMANRPPSPATGLLIYQIDNNPGFYYFDGSDWKTFAKSGAALPGGTEVSGTSGLKVSSTNAGSGTTDWIAINAGGTAGDRVVAGNLFGKANIGAHNNTLTAWSDLTLNSGGGTVIVGGQNLSPQPGSNGQALARTLVVNGSMRQSYYSQNVTISGNTSTEFTWNHNLGYSPILMMNVDQISSLGNMENCTYTSYPIDTNNTRFVIKNTGSSTASGRLRWILVH